MLNALDGLIPKWKFSHIPTSGVKVTATTKKGTYLVGSFGSDLEFILKELDYPVIGELNVFFPLLKGQKFNLLNVSDEIYKFYIKSKNGGFFTNVNAKWIDSAIKKEMKIIVMSDFKHLRFSVFNEFGEKIGEKLTGFGKEIHRLEWKHGYRFDKRLKQMLPLNKTNILKTITRKMNIKLKINYNEINKI